MKFMLKDFLKQMDHEIPSCCIQLSSNGYKIDGTDGLKTKLRIVDSCGKTPKSLDYIREYNNKLFFIEFSDLVSQHKQQQNTYKIIKGSLKKCYKSERKRLNRILSFSTQIKDEISQKINDTDFILREIISKNLITDFIDIKLYGDIFIFIVWNSEESEIGIDTARMLDELRSSIKSLISRFNLEYLFKPMTKILFLTILEYKNRYD